MGVAVKNPYDSYLVRNVNDKHERESAAARLEGLAVGILAYLCFVMIANCIFP